jgi:hypothetical protein
MYHEKIRIICCIVVLSLGISHCVIFSQPIEYISGKVINLQTSEPVPFTTVMLKNNKIGVFANADGDFQILCNKSFETDSLIVTCIGFERKVIPFRNMVKGQINRILLNSNTYSLNEVKIVESKRRLRPEQAVRRAIENINKNYPLTPFSYISYYRDYQKRDEAYINLNEAIIQTWDTGFYSNDFFNRYVLLDFKENKEFLRKNMTSLYNNKNRSIPIATLPDRGGNELLILMAHDALRNFKNRSFSFVDIFSKDFINNHNFSEISEVTNDNQLLYKIKFSAIWQLTGDTLQFGGEIFIQPKNYAIHKIDYTGVYTPEGKEKKEMFNVKIEYGYDNRMDNLMHLKYISFNNLFNFYDTAAYFRISKISMDSTDNSTITVDFNNKIDYLSASIPASYKLMFGRNQAKIKDISVGDRRVIIKLNAGQNLKGNPALYIKDIKDADGNFLNEGSNVEYYQYRELFVQEYNKPVILKDTCYLENKPLKENPVSGYTGEKKYWMNTPINVKKQDQMK